MNNKYWNFKIGTNDRYEKGKTEQHKGWVMPRQPVKNWEKTYIIINSHFYILNRLSMKICICNIWDNAGKANMVVMHGRNDTGVLLNKEIR